MSSVFVCLVPSIALNTLSRLKGIETFFIHIASAHNIISEYTFPFEGNWNFNMVLTFTVNEVPLNTLSRLKGIETLSRHTSFSARYTLNTLSRLKGMETQRTWSYGSSAYLRNSEYTFPFEGNGNPRDPATLLMIVAFSEYTFPFEGNGNVKAANGSKAILNSEYTFPFEGNGNSW